MNNYEEKQVFKWRWRIFFSIALFTLLSTLLLGEVRESLAALIIIGVVLLLTALLLVAMKQIVRIDANGVNYKQSPFHRQFQQIPWSDIQDWKIIKMNAFSDFGGWGIRITSKKKGYIMEGAYGLELKTSAKKLIVVSIKDEIAVEKAINQYFK